MKSAVYNAWVWLFARPSFAKLNRFLFLASLRGLGILNHGSMRESGERHFLEVTLGRQDAQGEEPRVVLDVGANVGNYAREVLDVAPAVVLHCFEPHPANVEKLRRAVNDQSVTVVPCAVGAAPGSLELFDYSDQDGSSHASVYKEVFEKIHKRPHVAHRVDVIALDDYIERHGIRAVALLKIDTEGHELAVLNGAARSLRAGIVDAVHFEFNEMNIASRTFLADFFEALPGFRLYRLLPEGWVPVINRPLENIFAYQNIVAVREGGRAALALERAKGRP